MAASTAACGGAEGVRSGPSPALTPPEGQPDASTSVENPDAAALDAGANDATVGIIEQDGFTTCSAIQLEASVRSVPMDIVWVIDSSPSMRNERAAIQDNLNRFATQFADAAVDVRVVVITDGGDFEVPPPLGADPARFLFIDRNVGSDDALSFFVERFAEYAGFLRREAKLELIAVTDDESDLEAAEFLVSMQSAVAKEFRLHAIASERVDGRACEGAASPGDEYYAAAAATGGLTFSVCQADGSALFDELARGITEGAPLPCTLDIPEPPDGQQLDPDLINVVYDAGSAGGASAIPRVTGSDACTDLGWFYEDADTLSLCPSTCARFDTGSLRIEFGCRTVVF